LPGLINNIEIAIFAKEVAPGRAGQALGAYDFIMDIYLSLLFVEKYIV